MDCADIAVAVLAAGQGSRFGSDKLMADLDGIPLGLHIARTIKSMNFSWRFAVCAGGAAIALHYDRFDIIENAAPENGQSHSLHLAVGAADATDAQALLILLADMPFVSAGHIAKLVGCNALVASTDGDKPMPPALFPRAYWPELLRTRGDSGARSLLANAALISASPEELRDIDVVEDLHRPQP
jgi:molybdenum cofactor cytidylyltransferase